MTGLCVGHFGGEPSTLVVYAPYQHYFEEVL